MAKNSDPFGVRDSFQMGSGRAGLFRLSKLESAGIANVSRLPFSIRILLESLLRNYDGYAVTEQDVRNLASWNAAAPAEVEIPFKPTRVVLQDFTGVPCVVDLAAMRSAIERMGGDPQKINPLIPVDLVIDHSVQVDSFGSDSALAINVDLEFQRNRERYEFLRWGQKAFNNFNVVPPSIGIVHQVNLEFLAKGVFLQRTDDGQMAMPDTLVGTDSHTTMINGLGVVGWGVGGIEAEAVMLGQPLYLLLPEVIGFEITGQLRPGVTATDLVLTVTEVLRREKVVGKFVEFFGAGVSNMTLPDRATIGNMAPEYGATVGYFPVDGETLRYLGMTGRSDQEVQLVERYYKEQGLFRTDESRPVYTKTVRLDLASVETSLAGPKRPQDRVPLSQVKQAFEHSLVAPLAERGFALDGRSLARTAKVIDNGRTSEIGHGAVVIASITSCTNTSNPSVMMAAGLLAKAATEKGLKSKSHVKTSLGPGSRVVADYFEKAGLMQPLEKLGFSIVGYGCITCIGNSGPLPEPVAQAITQGDLVAAAVLSGNRNFEGRINALVKANYLASPPLVVAYALAGRIDIDLTTEPLGTGSDGKPVFLRDIWPSAELVNQTIERAISPEMFRKRYTNVWQSNPKWNALPTSEGAIFDWKEESTYIQEPPFLLDLPVDPGPIQPIKASRCLAALGDSVTTDHISPAGSIGAKSPAGKYLLEHGVQPADFNSYGSRRGNDRVMTRGTFANIRIRNLLAPGTEGGVTRYLPANEIMSIFDASVRYQADGTPLIVLAGEEYGTGSSRDWAAKGTMLLGVKAVFAMSYERIHRSNLVGMGVLPLVLPKPYTALGLSGEEIFDIPIDDSLKPRAAIEVTATKADGVKVCFPVKVRIDTPVELDYYRNGGILQTVLRKLLRA